MSVLASNIDYKWVTEDADHLLNFVSLNHTRTELALVLVRYFKPVGRHSDENSGVLIYIVL